MEEKTMKICEKCGTQFPDNMSFCSKCGNALTSGIVYCSKCGSKNTSLDSFCKNCGESLNGSRDDLLENQISSVNSDELEWNLEETLSNNKKKNMLLIIVAIVLTTVLITVIVLAFNLKSAKKTMPSNVGVKSQNESTDTNSFRKYNSCYKGIDKSFASLIVSESQKGELKVYKQLLGEALQNKNIEKCKDNYNKLNDLKNVIRSDSKDKINELKNKINTYEKNQSAKKTKESTEYKKNKKLAEVAVNKEDYVNAKTYYVACLETLKQADKKKKDNAFNNTEQNQTDVLYQEGKLDYETYYKVYYNYLSGDNIPDDIRGRRYYVNTLFAAYGYRFENNSIQKFFDQQSWYFKDLSIEKGNQSAIVEKFDDIGRSNYDLLCGNMGCE